MLYKTNMEELSQEEYSNYIQKNLEQSFPQFIDYCRYEDDVYILEYPNPKNELIFWVSTQDDEVSIGLDKESECLWHTHMSQFGAYEPESELKEAIKFISELFDGKQLIVTNEKNEIYVTDKPEKTNELGNNVHFKSWNNF